MHQASGFMLIGFITSLTLICDDPGQYAFMRAMLCQHVALVPYEQMKYAVIGSGF